MDSELEPPEPPLNTAPKRARVVIRIARRAIIVGLFLLAAILGGLGGVLFAYGTDLPEISRLDDYQPNTITRLLARDGKVVAQFATERRVVIRYEDIAPVLRQAIISTEDADFEEHFGVSVTRILVTAIKDIVYRQNAGASTITQQLARDLFLRDYMRGGVYARSGLEGLERKIKEALVAIELEKRYTKREIFTFYANQINLGHGAYGVEAASRMYFNKSAKNLNLEEAAALAATIQTPARLSPFVDPERNRNRRNYVLRRMAEEGYITDAVAGEAQKQPTILRGQPQPDQSIAPYFAEEIRKKLEAQFGASALYEAGLTVQTTLDANLQLAMNRALDRGLRRLDKRHSLYRGPIRNLLATGKTIDGFTSDTWAKPIRSGDIVTAVVTAVPPSGAAPVRLRIAGRDAELSPKGFTWARKPASQLFKTGDLIEVEVRTVDDNGAFKDVQLEQAPIIEGAALAIDNRTGQIRAMTGGFSFARSKFNRATQAQRQVGSLFKPILYTAAVDHGYTATTMFVDEKVSYVAGPNQPPYEPHNYDGKFEGPITLRRALEDSRNIPAVQTIADLGPAEVIPYARRFGLRGNYQPYLSLALGAGEATLMEMTSAYSVFPNQGVRMDPFSVTTITDRDGNVREENRPQPHEAIRADTAFILTNLLRGVVQEGTAAAAAALMWPLAGKTGTMDDFTDAWFIGFDPNLTVGVWVGYDEKKPIGRGETGAQAALPIWMDIMRAYVDKDADRKNPPDFDAPGNIVFVTLGNGKVEAYINGTQPQEQPVTPPGSAPGTAPGTAPNPAAITPPAPSAGSTPRPTGSAPPAATPARPPAH
jgi:penicillin-binding protein 1A